MSLTDDDKHWIDAHFEQKLDAAFERFSRLMLDEVVGRLDGVSTALTSIDARLKVHAGMLQSGSRAITRFIRFSEHSEARWVALTKRVQAIEKKLGIEGNGTGNGGATERE